MHQSSTTSRSTTGQRTPCAPTPAPRAWLPAGVPAYERGDFEGCVAVGRRAARDRPRLRRGAGLHRRRGRPAGHL